MLTVWDAIKIRRSIRKFSPDDVSDEVINQMLEAARLAPSGSNRQPWRFMVVRDKEVKDELRRMCLGQRFIAEAPVVIVCFSDLERYSLDARRQRRKEFIESGVQSTLAGRFADPEYRAQLDSAPTPPRDELIAPARANTFIAIEHLVLMATALGVGTCWVAGTSAIPEIYRFFGLPDNLVLAAVVAVGYPAGEIPPPRPRLSLEEILLVPQPQHVGRQG
ncbi:MAG: nitroreductase family protein [Chloroflexi bacterium]|nr:nitroreductase family protein [Chloroflexota bacterium]